MKKALRHITRTESSFIVRFYQGDANRGWKFRKCLQRSFNIKENGGVGKALEKAKEWRDKKAEQLNRPLDKKLIKAVNNRKNNTGMPGVSLTDYYRVRENGTYSRVLGYVANWVERVDGVRKSRNKLFIFKEDDEVGKRNSFRLACRLRKQMVAKHYTKRKPIKS